MMLFLVLLISSALSAGLTATSGDTILLSQSSLRNFTRNGEFCEQQLDFFLHASATQVNDGNWQDKVVRLYVTNYTTCNVTFLQRSSFSISTNCQYVQNNVSSANLTCSSLQLNSTDNSNSNSNSSSNMATADINVVFTNVTVAQNRLRIRRFFFNQTQLTETITGRLCDANVTGTIIFNGIDLLNTTFVVRYASIANQTTGNLTTSVLLPSSNANACCCSPTSSCSG